MTGDAKPQKTWKNLGIRAISALAFAAIVFLPFYFGGLSWAIAVLLLGAWAIWEWVRMTDEAPSWIAYAVPFLALIFALSYQYSGEIMFILPTLVTASVLAFFERQSRPGEARWAALAPFYLILPCAAFIALRGDGAGFTDHGFKLVMYLIVIVIAADVGAYFGGSYFQGPKMAPKISPKKTWSGFICGVIAGVLIGAAFGICLKMGPWLAGAIALPIVFLSVIGDILESSIKRRMDVKDAGDILPGHGGLLDRLDSMVLVILATMLAAHLVNIWDYI